MLATIGMFAEMGYLILGADLKTSQNTIGAGARTLSGQGNLITRRKQNDR